MAVGVYRDCRIDGVYQEQCIAVRLWMRTLSMPPQTSPQESLQILLVSYMPLALSARRGRTFGCFQSSCDRYGLQDPALIDIKAQSSWVDR